MDYSEIYALMVSDAFRKRKLGLKIGEMIFDWQPKPKVIYIFLCKNWF